MIIQADARHIPLADESVQTVVTSPPYWGLRDYGIAPSIWGGRDCVHEWGDEIVSETGRNDTDPETLARRAAQYGTGTGNGSAVGKQTVTSSFCSLCSAWRGTLGLEPTPELYVQHIVEVFREVRRVLRKDGTCWVNLGDSYCAQPAGNKIPSGFSQTRPSRISGNGDQETVVLPQRNYNGLKPKDLVGIPWRVAFALQADGWWLRSDIIWNKPNPMPESVTDRPTKSHEYIFLLAKSESYYYDAEAIREPSIKVDAQQSYHRADNPKYNGAPHERWLDQFDGRVWGEAGARNKRSVWTVATQPYPEAHFATFPEDLIKPCILAGTSARGCCAECGAPWERVVENTGSNWAERKQAGAPMRDGLASPKGTPSNRKGEIETKTLGWRPGCDCEGVDRWITRVSVPEAGEPTKPCIVLDPFVGSGTTVKVAQDLGRIGIGLDLKPEYLKMGRHRSAQQGLVLA
jgi:DNA modification methylase